jgi:uncharacterized damage-inducible protein DinB
MIEIIQKEFHRRIIEEGYARIEKCMSQLSTEDIWYIPNENSNSMGNLAMHLNGNVRQYIVSGIGGVKDIRQRDSEFDKTNKKPISEILKDLKMTIEKSYNVITQLDENVLTEKRKVQGFDETVLSIIIHVIEHFSYHVGQITYFTKARKNIDTAYYAGLDLNIT